LTLGALVAPLRQRYAHLGEFTLASGDVIHDAVIGYRTAGTLNATRSNAVLLIPWYQGRSRQLAWQVAYRKLVDPSKYYVIMVDAFGNGVSSSPSTSVRQPSEAFPEFTTADLVASQYQFLTRTLGLSRVHAVVGTSMGGMQAFQWSTQYPHFVRKVIPIVGSPQSQPDDRQRSAEVIAHCEVPARTRAGRMLSQWKPRAALNEWMIDPHDCISQAKAIMTLDITREFGGSLETAAGRLQAELLVVTTWGDREVNPAPAFAFARLAKAEILELDGRCGHQAPSCEAATVRAAIGRFLDR
jgi:homoserine O-acetyltransferase